MDLINDVLHEDWLRAIRAATQPNCELLRVGFIGGGSINDARKIETTQGTFFAKLNTADRFPGMLEAEADGLEFLRRVSAFKIPKPIATGTTENTQWILMEYIESAPKSNRFWEDFGAQLAKLHRQSAPQFGYDKSNYLGSLPQSNTKMEFWPEFFVKERLQPQLKMAQESGEASADMSRLFEKLFTRVERYFPKEPPAALHGDLWTGNFSTDSGGNATIFDPAVYYGHREMDIAMSRLFGGFDTRFYLAYHEAYPLESDWEERLHIANLYPLLAHLNIFGGSYAGQIVSTLRKYV
jgi:fructosamine-3-kinase